ncbi:hypothetical protein B0H10DRAFT_1962858 [Mycena sp. CBHHK59/15]|nr:hypothetical protein B0H10DRAFT_1962858 [Mycena sp. CBHHK59/15]
MIACNERKQAFNFAGGTRVNPAVPWDYTPLRTLVSLHGAEAGRDEQICFLSGAGTTTPTVRRRPPFPTGTPYSALNRPCPISHQSSTLYLLSLDAAFDHTCLYLARMQFLPHGVLHTHFGKPGAGFRSPGSLGFHNTVLDRLPITLTSLPPFRTCRDLIMISLYARILHCLLLVSKKATLEDYAKDCDSWSTLADLIKFTP